MPRKQRLIRERARRLRDQMDMGDYVAKSAHGQKLRNQFKGHVRDLARAYTEISIETLVRLQGRKQNPNVQLLAATALLERGWGKPAQTIMGDQDNPVQVNHVHEIKRTFVRADAANDEDRKLRPEITLHRVPRS